MVDINDREAEGLEWRGYVRRALEGIDKQLCSINKQIQALDKGVNGMKVRVATIGGTVSLVVTILVLLLSKIIS